MPSTVIPMKVLTEQVAEAIDSRRVKTAVFTTFSFDPGFFELNILPVLFDNPFSQPDKVRRLQLEDALRTVDHVAVYYDRRALARDGEPAQLDYRRFDVSRRTGYFHPKVILLLVDEHQETGGETTDDGNDSKPVRQALVVGILSANLTRAGWWENVECAHFEEIDDRDIDDRACSFRADLLSLIRRVRLSATTEDDQSALDEINAFLVSRTQRDSFGKNKSGGTYHTRIFGGQSQKTLSDWLRQYSLDRRDLNLEIISPYFDPEDEGPLHDLTNALRPREIRVFLPTELDGALMVTKATYEAVGSLERTRWARLPGEVVKRGRDDTSEGLTPRRVHAKVYRLWKKGGPDLLIVGSPNLTRAGHSPAAAGNLEAAFFSDITDAGYHRSWWLEPLIRDADRFASTTSMEEEGLDEVGLDLSLQFDWGKKRLSYRLNDSTADRFKVLTTAGEFLAAVNKPRRGSWTALGSAASSRLEDLLLSTSFLIVEHQGQSWRVLVREENMGHRPSLLMQLTPEEILEYWSLLTPHQRGQFMEERIVDQVEGLPVTAVDRLDPSDTLFDRFAGIYHAFGCLEHAVDRALEERRQKEADARLLGAKYDSLPNLLKKTLDRPDGDPILKYVVFLCAAQLRRVLNCRHRDFFRQRKKHVKQLDELLDHLPALRNSIEIDDADADQFLQWYEEAFLKPASQLRTGR